MADGRYLARGGGETARESVLVLETVGTPGPAPKRRRRGRDLDAASPPTTLPLARVTVVRAHAPFDSADDAARWLERMSGSGDEVDALLAEAIDLLNRALHAHATASADPRAVELSPEGAVKARIGYGSGEQVAAGRFAAAEEIDVRATGQSRRRRVRVEDLRPQERTAAVLGGRARIDACETLILRARADLDAGRDREAALQLRVGLEALLAELSGAVRDPGHDRDMEALHERRGEAGKAANAALNDELDDSERSNVRELLEICERVLRRRRVLRG